MTRKIIICFLLIYYTTGLASTSTHDQFKYSVGDPLGPDHWKDNFNSCSGKYQSPIDIEESLVTEVQLPALTFTGIDSPPFYTNATNNGHTVMLQFNFTEPVTISGGPLIKPLYNFQQMHFHWGVNDSFGSEDMINNHSYAMELHMVFYNIDYNENQTDNDAITVLAFFFEVSKEDNPIYENIVSGLDYILKPRTSVTLNKTNALRDMLPTNLHNYFTYTGSLTTPPCSEGVRWIDFKHPIRLSHRQLEKFRTIEGDDGVLLTHNVRPVQPLYNRPVWYANNEPETPPQSPGFAVTIGGMKPIVIVLFVVCVFLVHNNF